MDFAFLGIIAFFNFAVIIAKLNRGRYSDATLDVASLFFLNAMFAGSFGGAVVATVASAVMSLYLFFTPLKFIPTFGNEKESTEEEKTPNDKEQAASIDDIYKEFGIERG